MEDWKRLHHSAKIFSCPLNEAIFDSAYFLELGDKKYKKWFDLGNSLKLYGLLNHYQSSIEIRINGKKQLKISSAELKGDNLLFPLYQTTTSDVGSFQRGEGNLTIVEKEVGTLANYIFETEKFSIDSLHFSIKTVTVHENINFTILTNLNYLQKELVANRKSDTVVKERFALL